MNYFDFDNYDEQAVKNIPVVFAIPGLVYGIEESLFESIDAVRKSLGRKQIDIFIYTWDVPSNSAYISKVLEYVNKRPGLNLILKTDWYNNPENLEFFKYILSKLGLDVSSDVDFNLDIHNFKRIIPLLAYHNIYKLIYDRTYANPQLAQQGVPLVIKLKPNASFINNSIIEKHFATAFVEVLKNGQKQTSVMEHKSFESPYDIFFTSACGSGFVDDIFYYSSSDTLYNIFCSSKESLADKIIEVYKEHLEIYPNEVNTLLDLQVFASTSKFLTLEGSVFTHQLIKKASKPITYMTPFTTLPLTSGIYRNIRNPMFCIKNGKVEEKVKGVL